MKLIGWEKLFAPHILKRGEDYFYDDRVSDLCFDDTVITACVSGTEEYDVEIELSTNCVENMFCSCPYAEDGNACKHMAAVLYALTDGTASIAAGGNEAQIFNESLESVVAALDEKDMRQLLLDLGRNNTKVAERIRIRASGKTSNTLKIKWAERIFAITKRYTDRSGYVDYDNAYAYTSALKEILDDYVPELLKNSLTADAFDLVGVVFTEAAKTEMDDSDGGLTELFDCCVTHWNTILGNADKVQRKEMHHWFLAKRGAEDLAYGQDFVEEVLFYSFHDEELLRKNLSILDADIQRTEENVPYLEFLVRHRLKTMEKLGMGQEAMQSFESRFLSLPAVRKQRIDRLSSQGYYDEAIHLLLESKELDREWLGLVREYSDMLIALYEKSGRREEQKEELLFYLSTFAQCDLRYVDMLRETTDMESWPAIRERLLELPTMVNVSGDLLKKEGLYKRLLEKILRSNSIYEIDRYEKVLREHYPNELRDFNAYFLRRSMKTASDRNQYRTLIQRLQALKQYPCGSQEAEKIADEWRRNFPRRKSLLDELKKAGF